MKKRKRRIRHSQNYFLYALLTFLCIAAIVVILCDNVQIDVQDETISVGTGETYTDAKATISVCGFDYDVSRFLKKVGDADETVLGVYNIIYQMPFSSKTYHKQVNVIDDIPPVLTLLGDTDVTIENFVEYDDKGYIATDNYDGNLQYRVKKTIDIINSNYYLEEYSVSDSSGNIATARRTIKLVTGKIFLTFDDGPSWETTPELLDLLKERNVQATFFINGYSEDEAELVKRAYDEGHTIGLHGYSHEYSLIYQSLDDLMENFYKLQKDVEKTTGGYIAKLIRFPGGTSNTVSKNYSQGIMTQAIERVNAEGFIYYDWNVDSNDAAGTKNADRIFQNVVTGIRAGRDNVILMHDYADNPELVEAVEKIIDYCQASGYLLLPITEENQPVQHSASN